MKMNFKLVQSHSDGLCVSDRVGTIEEASARIMCIKGWDSRQEMNDAIERWAKVAKKGDIFACKNTAIVAC